MANHAGVMIPYPTKTPDGSQCLKTFPEGASQSFKRGAFVGLSSGKVVVYAPDSHTTLLGIAMHDASGTTNNDVLVFVMRPGAEVAVSLYHSSAASAVATQANVGTAYAPTIQNDAGSVARGCLDIADTTGDAILRITRLIDPAGTQYGYVAVECISTGRQMEV